MPPELKAEVVEVLMKHFALTEQEVQQCIFSYGFDYRTCENAPLRVNHGREEEPIPA